LKRVALLAIALAACARPTTPPVTAPPPAEPIAAAWRFEVSAGEGARELAIEAVIPAAEPIALEGETRFVSGVELSTGGPFRALAPDRGSYRLPACPPAGCRLRYRFALAEAAQRTRDIFCAEEVRGAILTSPSAWLLHPEEHVESRRVELVVRTPPGTAFVSGLLPLDPARFSLPPAAYAADLTDLPSPAWSAFGPLRLLRVDEPEQAIDLAIAPGPLDARDDDLRAWVTSATSALRRYYGRASIRRALVIVVPQPGSRAGFARTLGNGGATIVANMGEHTTRADLEGGWELIHELFHVSFPKLPIDQRWLEEGMATYVEPLLRARLGRITPEQAFASFRARMPLGQPEPGDQGLDRTHTWGRTYWGGAMFCLLADVQIRLSTNNRRSLDDALRAILAAGGNVADRWEMDRIVAVGDDATGVPALRDLYARLATRAEAIDLDALFARLGVRAAGEGVTFDDAAELAHVRKAMVERYARAP
jgi:hypothetical protein